MTRATHEGPDMSFADDARDLLFCLGKVSGHLHKPEVRALLIAALRGDPMVSAYVAHARDSLSDALQASERPNGDAPAH